jgi:hypothetical protein
MRNAFAYFQSIAKPIGMQDFQPNDVFYFGGPASIRPTYHFEITARDLARISSNGVNLGGYEYLWWIDYGGVHFPEVSLTGIYSARAAGAHDLFVIPTLDLIVVHRIDNDPPIRDAKTIAEISNSGSVSEDRAQFGHLLKLILDAETGIDQISLHRAKKMATVEVLVS